MRHSTIFRSRWMALVWAAGILWMAYDFGSSQPADRNSSSDDANQLAALNAF